MKKFLLTSGIIWISTMLLLTVFVRFSSSPEPSSFLNGCDITQSFNITDWFSMMHDPACSNSLCRR